MLKKIATAAIVLTIATTGYSQLVTNDVVLKRTAADHKKKELENFQRAINLAKTKKWNLTFQTSSGTAYLVGVDALDMPIYYVTESNVVAAATTGASQLWPGGSSGLNLNGSSQSVRGKLGEWDGGRVRPDHQELNGRIIQVDAPSGVSDHSTHVAGTMMATGVNPTAKGMAFGYQDLQAYDFLNDASEMSLAAPNLILSNHSYGAISGWSYNSSQARWEFYGSPGANEDYKFGFYGAEAQMWDSIAYNAPFYLIVKSSGNNRGETGPPVGGIYWRRDATGAFVNAGPRPAGISSNDSYDVIPTAGTAKNILTIGAVGGISGGYTNPNDVLMSSFSSWGPTDDGRIKPDVVADGVNVFSSTGGSATSYGTMSGTSMSSPNATGSLLLLQEYWSQLHPGTFMRAATLKGLAIHTAEEAGAAPGPDYKFGWGLLNVAKGAQVIKSNNQLTHQIFENVLTNGNSFTMNIVASGPITATVSWTDPKGPQTPDGVLNNATRKLVNDLDIRITQGTNTYYPWKLDPANPDNAATTGDNDRDNVEKINIANPVPGTVYTVTITHKGTLERGLQAYSLILSGVNGVSYCTSGASNSAGARIDSVSFGNIHQKNAVNCTTYSDFTSVTGSVEPSQTLPIAVKLNSCDASSVDKIVKVYIDFNNNGNFTDPGENVATSGIINGNGTFNGNVTVPNNVVIGTLSVMRIIVEETSNPNDIVPCGNYPKGETQDYKIAFTTPSFDFKIDEQTNPTNPSCLSGNQYVTIKLKNTGTVAQSNIPVAMELKSGATTVLSATGVYTGTIAPNETRYFTFPKSFNFVAGSSYTLSTYLTSSSDQYRGNDTIKTNLVISAAQQAPVGVGRICGNEAILLSDLPGSNYLWFTDPAGDPIAAGDNVHTPVVTPNSTYYIGKGSRSILGLGAKSAFPNGGGYLSGTQGYMKYTAAIPLTLETVKMYTKYPGKVELIVGDITTETSSSFQFTTISSTMVDVGASSPTQAPGNQPGYDALDTGAVYYVNVALPAGNHALIVKPVGNANVFRNNNLTGTAYPFGYSEYISLTSNSAGTEGGNPQNYYYFLYDMRLKTDDCITNKGTVVATVAPTPTITRNGNTLTSSIQFGNQWKLNGTAISGANNQTYTPTQVGNYTVTTSDGFGCQRTSDVFSFVFTAVDPVTAASTEVTVAPNPTNGNFTVKYKAERKDDLVIEVVNAQGQTVYSKSYGNFVGNLSEQLHLARIAGVYVVKVQHGSKVVYKKIVIE